MAGNLKPLESSEYVSLFKFLGRSPRQPIVKMGYDDLLPGKYAYTYGSDFYDAVSNLGRDLKRGLCAAQPVVIVDGAHRPRPLTMHESLELLVTDFCTLKTQSGKDRSLKSRLRLWKSYSTTSTVLVYKGRKLKLIPYCESLLTVDYRVAAVTIDGIAIPSKDLNRSFKSSADVLSCAAWVEAVENDKPLLKEFFDIASSLYPGEVMTFYALGPQKKDTLAPLILDCGSGTSDIVAMDSLDAYTVLIRVLKSPDLREVKDGKTDV